MRTCYNCRDKGEDHIHLQSECKVHIRNDEYIELVSQAAAKAVQDVYLFYNDEDEDEDDYSDNPAEAP